MRHEFLICFCPQERQIKKSVGDKAIIINTISY